MPSIANKPTSKEQSEARKSVDVLKQVTTSSPKSLSVVFEVEGKTIAVPRNAVLVLEKVLNEMAEGRTVQVTGISEELTTQEAADLLQVSRPHLVKLLDTMKIPSKKVGTHRRVKRKDILKYESDLKALRRKNLDLLAQEAQDMKLGYE